MDSRRLGEKEAMMFPRQLHKIASITKERKSQETVEANGPLYVLNDNLGHELLCGFNVSAHSLEKSILLVAVSNVLVEFRHPVTRRGAKPPRRSPDNRGSLRSRRPK